MEKSAIIQIQESGNIPVLAGQLKGTHEPVALVPDSMSVESIDQYMENPTRFRLFYRTSTVDSFVQYNTEKTQEGATCFIDADEMSALTMFDLGTQEKPLHKAHKAKISLVKTSPYNALLNVAGAQMTQQNAAEFVEDWAESLEIVDMAGEKMQPRAAAKALRRITIESAMSMGSEVDDFSSSQSAMERIDVKNKEAMPATILFKCLPYNGIDERVFAVRVAVLTSHDRPKITFRIIRHETAIDEMAEEFKATLEGELEESGISVYIGSI